MASTFTTNLTLEKPAAGDQANAWGNTLNTNFDAIDTAISLKHAGTPQGNLAASFVGQVAIDTSNKVVYIATTAGNAGTAVWTQANAGTITVSGVVSGSGSFSGGAASITTSYAVNPVPSGIISQFGGNAAPTGYLLCDGSAVSRTTYADLYTAISTNYGSGDGSTTFNLPDLQDRFPVGKGSTYSLNNQGGVSSITPSGSVSSFTPSGSVSVTVNNHTLTESQIPAHNHLITHAGGGISANYFHPTYGASIPFGDNNTSIATNPFYQYPSACMTNTGGGQAHNHGASGSFSGSSVTPTFSGNSASTLPPYICVNYIIKT